jgi:hypothetical protein
LKKLSLLVVAFCALFLLTGVAQAQQLDLGFNVGTIFGQSATSAGPNFTPQSMGGGAYTAFKGDFLFFRKYFGVGAQVAWRAKQSVDASFQPFRPLLYDFNGVFAPPIGKKAQADLQAGVGLESIRFYQPFFNCTTFGCTNFTSSHHFLGHFGAGIRYYPMRAVFIAPEAHLYLIRNNFEFSGGRVTRFGITLGYSFKNQD